MAKRKRTLDSDRPVARYALEGTSRMLALADYGGLGDQINELVDNSIDAISRTTHPYGGYVHIFVRTDDAVNTLVMCDNGGGMVDVGSSLCVGLRNDSKQDHIGEHGLGLKAVLICRPGFKIRTKMQDSAGYIITSSQQTGDIPLWNPRINLRPQNKPIYVKGSNPIHHGTVIEFPISSYDMKSIYRVVSKKQRHTKANLKSFTANLKMILARTYAAVIKDHRVSIYTGSKKLDKPLEAHLPPEPFDTRTIPSTKLGYGVTVGLHKLSVLTPKEQKASKDRSYNIGIYKRATWGGHAVFLLNGRILCKTVLTDIFENSSEKYPWQDQIMTINLTKPDPGKHWPTTTSEKSGFLRKPKYYDLLGQVLTCGLRPTAVTTEVCMTEKQMTMRMVNTFKDCDSSCGITREYRVDKPCPGSIKSKCRLDVHIDNHNGTYIIEEHKRYNAGYKDLQQLLYYAFMYDNHLSQNPLEAESTLVLVLRASSHSEEVKRYGPIIVNNYKWHCKVRIEMKKWNT